VVEKFEHNPAFSPPRDWNDAPSLAGEAVALLLSCAALLTANVAE
jgi:hypothetical protein